jgi:hypothetical protein
MPASALCAQYGTSARGAVLIKQCAKCRLPGMNEAKPQSPTKEDKQCKSPGTRRRSLIKLGIDPSGVYKASRSSKGYWRISRNSLVRFTPSGLGLLGEKADG